MENNNLGIILVNKDVSSDGEKFNLSDLTYQYVSCFAKWWNHSFAHSYTIIKNYSPNWKKKKMKKTIKVYIHTNNRPKHE